MFTTSGLLGSRAYIRATGGGVGAYGSICAVHDRQITGALYVYLLTPRGDIVEASLTDVVVHRDSLPNTLTGGLPDGERQS